MPALSDYTSGTITLTNGSVNFTGAGTGWQAADFREGDVIFQVAGQTQWTAVVLSITSNTSGTLVRPWGGATGTYQYRMRYMADGARVTAQARNLIELLGNGNIQAEASLTGAADTLSYYTGPAAKALTPLTAFARTLLDDANAAAARETLGAVGGPVSAVNNRIAVFDGTSGKLLKDGGSTIAALVPADGSITNAKLANVPTATVKGRTAAGTGVPTDLTMVQLIALLRAAGNYDWANIVGTVSQSGGVPTGAIIERGSNANGEYVRYADGTQICNRNISISVAATSNFTDGAVTLWPAAFIGGLYANISAITNYSNALASATMTNVDTTSFIPRAFNQNNTNNTAGTCSVSVTAIGRWF